MRISDWSSDVCSSDLGLLPSVQAIAQDLPRHRRVRRATVQGCAAWQPTPPCPASSGPSRRRMSLLPARMPGAWNALEYRDSACRADRLIPTAPSRPFYQVPNGRDYRLASIHPSPCVRPHRSEEHTSELQSLMRISYAVL